MRLARILVCAALVLFCLAAPNRNLCQSDKSEKPDKSDKLSVTGKLTRVMAIGAETSGWAVELNPPFSVNGKQVSSIEIVAADTKKLESLENKVVKATGTLSNASGVETGERPVLNVSSIKAAKHKMPAPAAN
jgi:hypothetical protein